MCVIDLLLAYSKVLSIGMGNVRLRTRNERSEIVKGREPEMKGQIVKDEQEAKTRRLIHALPMSDVIILLHIQSEEEDHSLARYKAIPISFP